MIAETVFALICLNGNMIRACIQTEPHANVCHKAYRAETRSNPERVQYKCVSSKAKAQTEILMDRNQLIVKILE